ncbi:hypothetical protein GWI34_02880 [Actinomadura sp. DSM 109109]|nr:hypothetical protein [Actinomadura lepetitiana]
MSGTAASNQKPVWDEAPDGKERFVYPEAPGPVWDEAPDGKERWVHPEASGSADPGTAPAT